MRGLCAATREQPLHAAMKKKTPYNNEDPVQPKMNKYLCYRKLKKYNKIYLMEKKNML